MMEVTNVSLTRSVCDTEPVNRVTIVNDNESNCAIHVVGQNLDAGALSIELIGVTNSNQEEVILSLNSYCDLDIQGAITKHENSKAIIPVTFRKPYPRLQFIVAIRSIERGQPSQVFQVVHFNQSAQPVPRSSDVLVDDQNMLKRLAQRVDVLEENMKILIHERFISRLATNQAYITSDNISGGTVLGQGELPGYYNTDVDTEASIDWNIDNRLRFISLTSTEDHMVQSGSYRTLSTRTQPRQKDVFSLKENQNREIWDQFNTLSTLLCECNYLEYIRQGIQYLKKADQRHVSEWTPIRVFMELIIKNNLAVIYAGYGNAQSLVAILKECFELVKRCDIQLQLPASFQYVCSMVKLNYTTLLFEFYDFGSAKKYLTELLTDKVLSDYDIQYCNLLQLNIATYEKNSKLFGLIEEFVRLLNTQELDNSLIPIVLTTYGRILNCLSYTKDENKNDKLIPEKNQEARNILTKYCTSWDTCPIGALFELGRSYEFAVDENGQPNENCIRTSIDMYKKCYDRARDIKDGEMLIWVTSNLGNAHAKLKEYDRANEYYKESMDLRLLIIRQVTKVRCLEEAVSLVQTCERISRNWTRVLVDDGNFALALETVERMKCVTQLSAIKEKRPIDLSWMTVNDMVQVAIKQQQNVIYYYLNSDQTYNHKFNKLYIWIIPHSKIKAQVPENCHIITTDSGHNLYFIEHQIDTSSLTGIEEFFEAFQHFSTTKDSVPAESSWRQDSKKLLPLLKKMYEIIIQPFEWLIIGGHLNNIKFIPFGRLELIPFPALYNGTKHLIEMLPVSVHSSMRMMQVQEILYEQYGLDCLLFGAADTHIAAQRLPLGKGQLEKIATKLAANGLTKQKLFCEGNVTRQNIINGLKQNPKHVLIYNHYSPHIKRSHENRPFNTHGAFLMANNQHLNPSEMESLNTQVDLALIMCCSVISGTCSVEGFMGPIRSLSIAGFRSIIASLWPLNDEFACTFSDLFYATLEANPHLDKAEIYQKTCQQLIDSKEELYHWAGLMLHGSSNFMNSWNEPKRKLSPSVSNLLENPFVQPLQYVLVGILLSSLMTYCWRIITWYGQSQ